MSVLPPSSLKGGVGPVLVIVFLLQLLLVLLLLSLGLRVPPLQNLVRYGVGHTGGSRAQQDQGRGI